MEIFFLKAITSETQVIYLCLQTPRPGGEIGKRCGLRSRWEKSLESSSLSPGTQKSNSRSHAKLTKLDAKAVKYFHHNVLRSF